MTVVAFIMGLLLVLQLRAQGSAGGLGQLSTQDLTTLIASLNLGNGQLRDEVAQLEAQLRDMSDATASGRTNVGQLEADLLRLRRWSGSTIGNVPMGQGIAVTPIQMAAAYSSVANDGVWVSLTDCSPSAPGWLR